MNAKYETCGKKKFRDIQDNKLKTSNNIHENFNVKYETSHMK